jgi:hypothetical protein
MKTHFKHTLLLTTLSASLLAASLSYADSNGAVPVTPAPAANIDLTPVQADSPSIPPDYNTYLLAQGKDVYAQLQIARQAALNHNQAGFISALGQAREALDKVQVPGQVKALDKQLGIIKQDLGKQGNKLDTGLWIPVEANLRDALVFSSDTLINKAAASAKKGMEAARNNDSDNAKVALGELVDVSTYNLGVFPLTKVKADLDSASAAADNDSPYWSGALEAVQSALATFHWYDEVPSHGLLAAYTDAVSAYTLASSPNFLPAQRQSVIDQLGKAADELQKSPDTTELVAETRSLIDKVTPESGAIKRLLQHIQQQISDQRQQSEDQYLQNIAADVVNNP